MDNSDVHSVACALDETTGELYELVPLRLWHVAWARFEGVDQVADPAGHGECWECSSGTSEPLWIVGDFWLCRRCTMRRAAVRAKLATAD